MTQRPCSTCKGTRLKPESLAVTIEGKSIADVTHISITDGLADEETGDVVEQGVLHHG